ncbi:hypothetical protein DAEQUDRAFT_753793 [Daedalea quercina L-15889]|uniref:HNH nuclease domain-containing protein n=1 Tax=Daedalea quercina L-15889 TaxID=1314783 RepID=A0A165U2L0_9APHY|nr:hypothetical protein DAEQUDRAFT_753793 [Daedalea quercina L-15889]
MPLARKPTSTAPLPPNTYPHGDDIRKAYEDCLSLEQHELGWNVLATQLQDTPENIMADLNPKISARVLGWALLLAPSDEGRAALTREIIGCDGDPELLAGLAHLYVYGLIRVFYNPEGPTPSVSATQSPGLSFQQSVQSLEHSLQQPSITAQDIRQLILFRDDHRCVFTGALDLSSASTFAPNLMERRATRVAHIISQSLSENITWTTPAVHAQFGWAQTAGAIVERFGGFSPRDILGENDLHSPTNAFTATTEPHALFDNLDLWLTAAQDEQGGTIPHTYDVSLIDGEELLPRVGIGIKLRITLKATATVGGEVIPPPHPRLIALHAACAEIAHMSGAAEHLNEIFRDADAVSDMTEPNAAYELTRALKALRLVSTTT